MESKAKFLGHSVHMIMITMPLGLLSGAVGFDVLYAITGKKEWADASYRMIGAGILSGLAAATFGFIDWLALPTDTRAKRIGVFHALSNIVALSAFSFSWLARLPDPSKPGFLALSFSLVGGSVSGLAGWFGGELTNRMRVGIDDGAHLNSPNSLTGLPASENSSYIWLPQTGDSSE